MKDFISPGQAVKPAQPLNQWLSEAHRLYKLGVTTGDKRHFEASRRILFATAGRIATSFLPIGGIDL